MYVRLRFCYGARFVSVLWCAFAYRDERLVSRRVALLENCRDSAPSNFEKVGFLGSKEMDYTMYPAECAPDGVVLADKDGLPSFEGMYSVVCYTAEKARQLDVDMQGYEIDSPKANEIAEKLKAKYRDGKLPECKPKQSEKVDKSQEETLKQVIGQLDEAFQLFDPHSDAKSKGSHKTSSSHKDMQRSSGLNDLLGQLFGQEMGTNTRRAKKSSKPNKDEHMPAQLEDFLEEVFEPHIVSNARQPQRVSKTDHELFDLFDADEDGVLDFPEMVMFAHHMAVHSQRRWTLAFPFRFQLFVRQVMEDLMSEFRDEDRSLSLDSDEFDALLRSMFNGDLQFYISTNGDNMISQESSKTGDLVESEQTAKKVSSVTTQSEDGTVNINVDVEVTLK